MIIDEFQPKYDVTRKMQKIAELARVIQVEFLPLSRLQTVPGINSTV